MSPGRPPEERIRRVTFTVREPLQRPPNINHDQRLPPRTRNYPKFLWRIGKLSKPEYTDYCNNLHALHQEYLQGKIELDILQEGKQALMAPITKRFFTSATHNNRSRQPSNSTSFPPLILKLAQPSGHSQHRSTFSIRASNKAPYTKQHRRRRKEYRVALRESTVQQQRIAWWSNVHVRCKQLLNRKRPAASVVIGAAQTTPLTQRQLPVKKRRKKQKDTTGMSQK